MRSVLLALLALVISTATLKAKVVVFWQPGFPHIDNQPVPEQALREALAGLDASFDDRAALERDLAAAPIPNLLVLPYGSAFPADAWHAIHQYISAGGNLLAIGGQPFRVPVTQEGAGQFRQEQPQDTYAREIGIRHSYTAPERGEANFEWKEGYTFLSPIHLAAQRFFLLEGRLDGLGYLLNKDRERVAAAVVVQTVNSSRRVVLPFEASAGYWSSPDGISLLRAAATYAQAGATSFWLETQFATVRPGESALVTIHLARLTTTKDAAVHLELRSANALIAEEDVPCPNQTSQTEVIFRQKLQPGFYTVRGTYREAGRGREFYQNGFYVADEKAVTAGPRFGARGDFLLKDGQPLFPVGTNYFSTEERGWDFSGPRNGDVWRSDFADMERHGVTFVRTGVWMGHQRFLDANTGGVSERFLRNLEGYLLAAAEHHIVVNFTFFAFDPQTTLRLGGERSVMTFPGTNPYTDPVTVAAEKRYVLSVVNRFRNVPYLCWDLINEPSFSNPNRLWKGNTPNNDPAELAAWHRWLQSRYGSVENLAAAWSVPSDELGAFNRVPLPADTDLTLTRYRNANEVRAYDYNRFAQDMFSNWVAEMVRAIRSTGSKQLIDVGQDEGGVNNRLLNQYYAQAGVAFTTNHTYWQDHALLWDSIAAKRPGLPSIVGETGYQPVWRPAGEWRYDELTGFGLLERKLALGFTGGSSGALHWDWAREVDFGIERSDGSAKIWEGMLRDLGRFARTAAPYATELVAPEVAVVLPQSLQLSVFNPLAIEAQQTAIRALYHFARGAAYAVGEEQLNALRNPKLMILPSPWTLTEEAWQQLLQKVDEGAVLLTSGRIDNDEHFRSTDRHTQIGLKYRPALLSLRENRIVWPQGEAVLSYPGDKTTYLEQAVLPGGATFAEISHGQGKILFFALPLELNSNLQAVGDIYRYALAAADVKTAYETDLHDAGILISPMMFPHATLYTITSESNQTAVRFKDARSGKQFSGDLAPGRAALLLVGEDGKLISAYNWPEQTSASVSQTN